MLNLGWKRGKNSLGGGRRTHNQAEGNERKKDRAHEHELVGRKLGSHQSKEKVSRSQGKTKVRGAALR